MASNLIVLESVLAKNQDSQDFSITMNPPLILSNDYEYELALVNASLWYSWHNISEKLQNNIIRFHGPDGIMRYFTIPNGIYSMETLNDVIFSSLNTLQASIQDKETLVYLDANNVLRPRIYLSANYATMRFILNVIQKYDVTDVNDQRTIWIDFIQPPYSNIRELLGFDSGKYYLAATEAQNSSNIENNVESLHFHCSLCGSTFVNGASSDVICTYTPDNIPGTQLSIKPFIPLYVPLTTKNISNIRMRVTSQSDIPLLLNNEPVSYTLAIKRISN